MQYKFKLLKIHCAGCALALEQNLNTIEGVHAEIAFVTKVLKLEISTENPAETLTEVKMAIENFDHSIEIVDYVSDEDIAKKEKKERDFNIIKISISIALLLLAVLVPAKWFKITLFVLDYLLVSHKVLIKAAKNISHGKVFDENFLMGIASLGAFVIGEYVEAISVMILFSIGEILEDLAVSKSRKTIKSLLEIKQPYANLVVDDEEQKVELSEVSVGDLIRIKPGEKIPLDGEVVDGTSNLNMSALTGETKEKIVTVGDEVLSGSINGASVLLVKVTKLEAESTITKIVEMVEKATETKAKSEKFISKFSKWYTPTVIVLAVLIMFIPPIFSGYSNFLTYVYRGLSFLVVSCPCALVISVPLAYFAGIGSFARIGVLVKGASFVEELAKVDAVVFDKTGTLTKGDFEVTEINVFGSHTKEEVLETAAYAESFSNHRISNAIINEYKEKTGKDINSAWINDYTEIAGKGISANIFMQDVLVGNAKLLKEKEILFFEVSRTGSVIYVAIAGECAGFIVLEDTIKKDAVQTIRGLKGLGIKDISVCTGDEENVAKNICEKLAIKNCYSNLLPEDKVLIITDKVQEGKTVAFVGDGINDAPSIANANVGLAMGALGSDVAIETADVVLMKDEPSKVPQAIKKAKKVHKIVLQNIIGSILVKVATLALIGFGFSGMWLAVFADVGVNLIAVLNSLRAMLK
ncbi:MAG: cadmium-translocating P-type ATPase [Clostridia bacterium]|nr:cadmium-translocating P-type ATPase [Clostridia bacterium]